jgi:hypothetical protein
LEGNVWDGEGDGGNLGGILCRNGLFALTTEASNGDWKMMD